MSKWSTIKEGLRQMPAAGNEQYELEFDAGCDGMVKDATVNNSFCGIAEVTAENKIKVYLAPLAAEIVGRRADQEYQTQPPTFECRVCGAVVEPVVHSQRNTSHLQLYKLSHDGKEPSSVVLSERESVRGFTLLKKDGVQWEFSQTSMTFNPEKYPLPEGSTASAKGGKLEDLITTFLMSKILVYIKERNSLATLTIKTPGTS